MKGGSEGIEHDHESRQLKNGMMADDTTPGKASFIESFGMFGNNKTYQKAKQAYKSNVSHSVCDASNGFIIMHYVNVSAESMILKLLQIWRGIKLKSDVCCNKITIIPKFVTCYNIYHRQRLQMQFGRRSELKKLDVNK